MTTAEVSAHRQQFALVDCNNFYWSCERALNPKLDGVPMVVLSNNDGCAVARSNEVKALGVKMGTPWFQMKDLAKELGIVASLIILLMNRSFYSMECSVSGAHLLKWDSTYAIEFFNGRTCRSVSE